MGAAGDAGRRHDQRRRVRGRLVGSRGDIGARRQRSARRRGIGRAAPVGEAGADRRAVVGGRDAPAGVWPPAEGQTPVEGRVPADVRSPVSRGEARTAGRIDGRAPIELVASRYRSPAPIWTDPAVDEVLPQLRSTAVLAAVRSATVGMPVERAACAPFTDGRWAFSHNGVVQDWRRVLTAVATELGTAELLDAEAHTDSATLWVILRSLLDTAGPTGRSGDGQTGLSPTDPAVALRRLGSAVLARAPRARLNLLLGDGETLWATTVYHSLSVLVTDDVAVLASEPYDDDPRWQAVADGQLVTARPGHLSVVSLVSDESERARS